MQMDISPLRARRTADGLTDCRTGLSVTQTVPGPLSAHISAPSTKRDLDRGATLSQLAWHSQFDIVCTTISGGSGGSGHKFKNERGENCTAAMK